MIRIMERHGVPGAALAITKKGKLVYAKGFGWSNYQNADPVKPDTIFGLASLTKPFTAAAILLLMEQGKLQLDDPVFDHLKHIKPLRGIRFNPALREVTIRHCLTHTGGWDRYITGDAINWEPQICRTYQLRPPLSSAQLAGFIMGVPLNFRHSTEVKYSNVGYVLLGEVIAKEGGVGYEKFLQDHLLKPMGIQRMTLHSPRGQYRESESLRFLAGSMIPLPAMNLPMVNATGGLTASVVDLVRFLTNLDGSRGKRVLSEKLYETMLAPPAAHLVHPDGTYVGLGWDAVQKNQGSYSYFKDGNYQGMRTFMKRLPNEVNWAMVYNASIELDSQDIQLGRSTLQEVRKTIESHGKHPDIDLFGEFA